MMNMNVNRTHKDHVFRMIFREKTELLSLYNAINGSCYDTPDELIHYVLEDAMYIGMKNNEEEPALECVATVLNINYGHNAKLMSACRKLYEYSYLVKEIRIGQDLGLTIEAAIARAIDRCIENGILEELLRKERAKVTKSLLGQYGFDLHIKSEKKLSYDEGHQAGLEVGLETGHKEGQTEMKRLIVKNMLLEHLTDDQISKYTGCSQELINSVRHELNNHL